MRTLDELKTWLAEQLDYTNEILLKPNVEDVRFIHGKRYAYEEIAKALNFEVVTRTELK